MGTILICFLGRFRCILARLGALSGQQMDQLKIISCAPGIPEYLAACLSLLALRGAGDLSGSGSFVVWGAPLVPAPPEQPRTWW